MCLLALATGLTAHSSPVPTAGALAADTADQLMLAGAPINTGSLRCFSFYDFFLIPHYEAYYNTSFESIAAWMNCPSFGATNETISFANQLWDSGHRQYILWKLADTNIWTYPCSARLHAPVVYRSARCEIC